QIIGFTKQKPKLRRHLLLLKMDQPGIAVSLEQQRDRSLLIQLLWKHDLDSRIRRTRLLRPYLAGNLVNNPSGLHSNSRPANAKYDSNAKPHSKNTAHVLAPVGRLKSMKTQHRKGSSRIILRGILCATIWYQS